MFGPRCNNNTDNNICWHFFIFVIQHDIRLKKERMSITVHTSFVFRFYDTVGGPTIATAKLYRGIHNTVVTFSTVWVRKKPQRLFAVVYMFILYTYTTSCFLSLSQWRFFFAIIKTLLFGLPLQILRPFTTRHANVLKYSEGKPLFPNIAQVQYTSFGISSKIRHITYNHIFWSLIKL